ncbi:hypothetical protein ABIC03_006645 [Bradyrhizobium sp. RT6a]|uniref:hypothetical protein n=1 Tax=Bradyrhizobium sp. RT6a TaxID=3156381 RepID=UPI0033946656
MDHEELAARAAVACWQGSEGRYAEAIRTARRLDADGLARFLNLWMLARSNPLNKRGALLNFLNDHVMPTLLGIDHASDEAYGVIEDLSAKALKEGATLGRPTSMLSKLALAVCPLVYIPYDARVQNALRRAGKGISPHSYRNYMRAVLSEKPAFDQNLARRGLSIETLDGGAMSRALFEMRALDKWLMLRGGFNPETMLRELSRPAH